MRRTSWFELEGADKLTLKLKRLTGMLSDKDLGNRYLDAAKVIRNAAKRRAPIAKKGHWSKKGKGGTRHWLEPGALKRSIVAKKFKSRTIYPPAAFCAINYGIAPHAHLVEFGARGGQMPAQPFFRPAIDESKSRVKAIIKDGLKKAVLKAVKK